MPRAACRFVFRRCGNGFVFIPKAHQNLTPDHWTDRAVAAIQPTNLKYHSLIVKGKFIANIAKHNLLAEFGTLVSFMAFYLEMA